MNTFFIKYKLKRVIKSKMTISKYKFIFTATPIYFVCKRDSKVVKISE